MKAVRSDRVYCIRGEVLPLYNSEMQFYSLVGCQGFCHSYGYFYNPNLEENKSNPLIFLSPASLLALSFKYQHQMTRPILA